jgi:hypothetical protein
MADSLMLWPANRYGSTVGTAGTALDMGLVIFLLSMKGLSA